MFCRSRRAWVAAVLLVAGGVISAARAGERPYPEVVREDRPVAYWRFSETDPKQVRCEGDVPGECKVSGRVAFGVPGPRPETYPAFGPDNRAASFPGKGCFIRVPDAGKDSPLKFARGDAITLEAWVNPARIGDGQHVYVVGKGRTQRPGFAANNQNYALRLTGKGGLASASFLFRGEPNRTEKDWHRWTSAVGFPLDGRWHHVAVSYVFGEPGSVRGYVDGKPVKGAWDMGGATTAGPVVDDDELWIGSSMGGSPGSTFEGGIDEVAIYRTELSPERVRQRYRAVPPKPYARKGPLPADGVLVEVFEGVGESSAVPPTNPPTTTYVERAFGFPTYPQKYSEKGIRTDRKAPLLFRATGKVALPAGEYELLVRARGDARLYVDGKELLHVPKLKLSGSAHGRLTDVRKVKEAGIHPLWPGDNEGVVTFVSDGAAHEFRLDMILGEKGRRPETGESCVAVRRGKGPFQLLGFAGPVPLTDEGWHAYARAAEDRVAAIDRRARREAGTREQAYWQRRHEIARAIVSQKPGPEVPRPKDTSAVFNDIDRFVNARLEREGKKPAGLIDDWAFLRRATVDVTGTVPTEGQIERFFADDSPDRRKRYVEYLLRQPGWADNWVGYWQDVLAENPNILKPTLNNTGPFRWWIHESFEDNKPFDRFVTELVLMEGSQYFGGPGGFAMATENDVPMAAKGHVIGQAFLGLEMKCARCHDAPFHDFEQGDLFRMAAMLNRGPQEVPKTSSIPLSEEALKSLIVTVSLKPGTKVAPGWPFPELAPAEVPDGLARDPQDTRERLAALVTSPHNERFAKVIVNRMWRRYMGRGIVEPVDDWSKGEASHPELLEWLARELVLSGYDLKHVARLILTSHTYQRRPADPKSVSEYEPYLFAGPLRRRMTAEQVLDSLFVAAGKEFNAGELNFDVDGANPYKTFLNLGSPERAWQFTSLSNERDRPSLALPFAQDFVSLLETFGWRSSRQDPLTVRDGEPTVLQPAIMANGIVTGRVTRISDDGELADLAVEDQPLDRFVERLSLRFLTRPPTSDERRAFGELLRDGYAERVADFDPSQVVRWRSRPAGVSWSNHLSPEANAIKVKLEALVRQGDPPSVRLRRDWRERAEDVIWALANTPEFVWLP